MFQDFYAIIVIKREEAMKSKYPAAFHKILGRMVIDYMLLDLSKLGVKNIIVLAEHEDYFKYLGDAPVDVVCRCMDSASIQDIKKEFGEDKAYAVIEEARHIITKLDLVSIMCGEKPYGGIINRSYLQTAAHAMQQSINYEHGSNGVNIMGINIYIGPDVKIGMDTVIYPGAIIEGDSIIGEDCIIGPNCRLENVKIGNRVHITESVATDAEIGDGSTVGPFAYLRPGSVLGKNVKIGDFVEVKNAVMGDNSKASHLSYIGDADVGKNVNIGCGTVTANYDGQRKHRTTIEDNAFIGTGTYLIAPVTICKNATTAAGSTINKDVPKDALGIARARQSNVENWAHRKK